MANGRVGRASEGGIGRSCFEVNETGHGYAGGVGLPPGSVGNKVVMKSPKVYAIYWDEYFQVNPQTVYTMNQFFSQILTGRYMRQLEQYGGIGLGQFLGSSVIVPDPASPPPAPPALLDAAQIEGQLQHWISNKTVSVRPDKDETNLLYVIFTPSNTNMGDCLAGSHGHARYDEIPSVQKMDDNLFWAAIQQWHEYGTPSSGREFADSCTWAVSHEMVEAFTNRDERGFAYRPGDGNSYEIGDICECARGSKAEKTPIITTQIDGWVVETYWDNTNQSCYPLHIVPRNQAPEVGYEILRRQNEQRQKRQP